VTEEKKPEEKKAGREGSSWQVAVEDWSVVFSLTLPSAGDPLHGMKIDVYLTVERSAELRKQLEMAEDVIAAQRAGLPKGN
jgi:hypothetical protein